MNRYVQALLLFIFIIGNETIPFLYNDAYTVKEMNWGWIISFPLVLLVASFFNEDKNKKTKD